MKIKSLKSDFLLLLASAIWGFAFVAQRQAMYFIGPFLYNGIRFTIGLLFLFPFYYFNRNNKNRSIYKLESKRVVSVVL